MVRFRLEDVPVSERPMADPSPNAKLRLELLRQIDGLCSKYEAALRAGERPDPAKLLEHLHDPASKSAESPARETSLLPRARRKLLCELLLLELEYHAPTDHEAVIVEWMRRFPDCIDVIKAARARAAARSGGSTRGTQGQGRTPSPHPCQPGSTATNAPPHESGPLTVRPQRLRTPKNPSATPGLPQTVNYSPRLGTKEPVPKTVPTLSPTQPPESGHCATSGSSGSSPNQDEGAPPMRSIGRFQLLSVVGQGSFGTVYRAYDPVLDREVALKVPKFVAREPEQIKRFLTEAKAAARLRHPNIVAVFEAGEADGLDYIVTEFVSGETLSRRLKRERPRFRQAAQWVRDLGLALEYAHGEGVIHRDIKPDNIMIGDSQRPQLMDFGLAKVLAEAAPADSQKPVTGAGYQASSATADGTILGTPAYMAPEQARGDVKAVGPRADVYSLGVVLYELLTGQRPEIAKWGPGSSTVGSEGFLVHVPYRPRLVNALIPPNLEAICLQAMAQEPAERYASAADLAVDLQRWLQDANTRLVALTREADDFHGTNPVAARPPTLKERLIGSFEQPPPTTDAAWPAKDDRQDYMAEHAESRPRKEKKRKRKRKGATTAASGPLNTWTAAGMLLFTLLLVSSFTLSKMLGFSSAPPPFFDSQAEQEAERHAEKNSTADTASPTAPHSSSVQPLNGIPSTLEELQKQMMLQPQPPRNFKELVEELNRPGFHGPLPKSLFPQLPSNEVQQRPSAPLPEPKPSGLDPTDALAYHNRGRSYTETREYDKAIADFTEAIRLVPKTAGNYFWRAICFGVKGEHDKAIADFTETIRLDPKMAVAYHNRGLSYLVKREYDKAIADFTEAVGLDPNDADNYSRRAVCYGAKDEYDKAIADLTEAIRLDPNMAGAYCNRGTSYLRKGEYDKAIADSTEAIRLDPKMAVAHHNRGLSYGGKREYDKAIADFTEAIRLDPKAKHVYAARGACYAEKGLHDKAIADCTEAIRLDPKDADNYSGRATCYQKKHEYNLALKDYTEAIRIDPHNLDAHNAIAWLRATCPNNEIRDGKAAVEHATKACELSQWKNGGYFDTLAAAYAEIGNFEEAIRWQKKALEVGLGPDVDAKEVEKARLRLTQYQQGRPYRED